MSAQIFTNH